MVLGGGIEVSLIALMCLIREAKFGNDSLAFYFFLFLFSLSLKCSAVYNMVLAT